MNQSDKLNDFFTSNPEAYSKFKSSMENFYYEPQINIPDYTKNIKLAPSIAEREAAADNRNTELMAEISSGNDRLVQQLEIANLSLNEMNTTLKSQLNSANTTLNMVLSSIGHNSQLTHRQLIEMNKSVAELKTLIEIGDSEGVNKFIADHGLESLALVLQVISMCFGA
ncbi:hypothetical protein [Niameybacter massiliensis]|uniref:hypothetical protein n=1 Tax=Niameybacter massiliensis TaxID=1658108 RepID=UPI0006B51DF9|nr:hypothetical protein [Niameybacter massiliensis]